MLLKAEKINFSFGKLKVLQNISLEVKKGQFFALVGPLGCGKTTLLKTLGGLIKPTKGKVYLSNRLLTKPSAEISFVFQKSNLMPWRTVEKNIILPLEIKKVPKKEVKKRVRKILKLINLEKFKNTYPNDLSGGMEQLTAIARSFIADAQILLLDEPFASLDAISREKMNQELLKLWQRKRKTIILVTHSIEEAVFLADKVLIMSQRPGRIKSIIKIDLPRPRQLSTISSPEFNSIVKTIRKAIG